MDVTKSPRATKGNESVQAAHWGPKWRVINRQIALIRLIVGGVGLSCSICSDKTPSEGFFRHVCWRHTAINHADGGWEVIRTDLRQMRPNWMCGKWKLKCAAVSLWLRRNPVIASLISLLHFSISSLHPLSVRGRRWSCWRSTARRPQKTTVAFSRDIWTAPSKRTGDFSCLLTVNVVDFKVILFQALSQINALRSWLIHNFWQWQMS